MADKNKAKKGKVIANQAISMGLSLINTRLGITAFLCGKSGIFTLKR